jgi:hypothetical protein
MRIVLAFGALALMFGAATGVAAAGGPVGSGNPDATSFVCPVLGGNAGAHGNAEVIATIGGGDSSIIGPNVLVPMHATNDNGSGAPGGSHASPGDDDYSPIWYGLTN